MWLVRGAPTLQAVKGILMGNLAARFYHHQTKPNSAYRLTSSHSFFHSASCHCHNSCFDPLPTPSPLLTLLFSGSWNVSAIKSLGSMDFRIQEKAWKWIWIQSTPLTYIMVTWHSYLAHPCHIHCSYKTTRQLFKLFPSSKTLFPNPGLYQSFPTNLTVILIRQPLTYTSLTLFLNIKYKNVGLLFV